MSVFENRLAVACKQVNEAAAELLEWIDENNDLVSSERIALLREIYRYGATAQRLAGAVNAQPTVAFVGPRRSGKTNLIAALIERGAGALTLRFDGIRDPVGFQKQIVPEGSRNSSACVIRLTSTSRPTPQGFPIAVRILSMTDLLKILIGSYFSSAADRRAQVPSQDRIKRMFAEAKKSLSPAPVTGLGEDDVWDIRDYVSAKFVDEPLLRALSASGFWEFLAEHAPQLQNGARGQLLSLLWGGLPSLTSAFVQFADTLSKLGYGREASLALDALLGLDSRTGRFQRRPDSIISTQILPQLGGADDQAIVVRSEFAQWVSVSRATLAAIVTEVRLPVKGFTSDLIEQADLLEFPAIDTHDAIADLRQALASDPGCFGSIFMRAKAAALVERYTSDQEITAMVVCVDPSMRKLGELAALVGSWVDRSHGAEPAVRELHDKGLFLALTKIDREITEPSRKGRDRRVDIAGRVGSILDEELGREHGWTREWAPSQPFGNVHLVRAPGIKSKTFCDYDNHGRELALKPLHADRIAQARKDFLADSGIARRIADPAAIWDEAFELNDGGASYLAQSIVEACGGRVKYRQIVSDLTGIRQSMKDRLERYYVSDNVMMQQNRRHSAALVVLRRLKHCVESRRFGHLLHALEVPEADVADLLRKIEQARHSRDVGGDEDTAKGGRRVQAAAASAQAERLASAAMGYWIERLRTVSASAEASRRLKVPSPVLQSLVDEMIVGASRLGLERQIAGRMAAALPDETDLEARVLVAAMCATKTIGDFVMWLGFDDAQSNRRPRRKGKGEVSIFPPRPAVDLASLGDEAAALDDRFFGDWSQAFLALVAESSTEQRERAASTDQNRKLGQLLKLLEINV